MRVNNFFLYLVALPIFMSFGNGLIPVFDRGPFGFSEESYIATFSVGIFSFVYFSVSSLFRGNIKTLALLSLSMLLGLVGYATAGRPQAVLVFQFFILLIIFGDILFNYSYCELKKICLTISAFLLIIQISAILNGLSGEFSAVIPGAVLIYNYEQYFSYGILLGLYFVAYFGKSKFYTFFYYLIAIFGAIDAENISVTYFLALFPFIRLFQFIFEKKFFGSDVKLLTVALSMLFVIGLPVYVLVINIFFPGLYDGEMIGGRGDSYTNHFTDFDMLSLFVPKMFYVQNIRDPHNTYLTFGVTTGYFVALFLMGWIVAYMRSLNFYHILFVAPFFALTFSLTEPLQHQYTAGLFALSLSVLLRVSSLKSSNEFPCNYKLKK